MISKALKMKRAWTLVALLGTIVLQDCNKNAAIQQTPTFASVKKTNGISSVIVKAVISKVSLANNGDYNYKIGLFVADVNAPTVPLQLPGNLGVSGVVTAGGVQHPFNVILPTGSTISYGTYILPSPVSLKGTSTSPGSYEGVTISFTGNYSEPAKDSTFNVIQPTFCGGTTNAAVMWGQYMYGSHTSGPNSYAAATDAAGNIYTAGSYGGTVDFGSGANALTGSGMFLRKLSSSGNFVWVKKIAGLTGYSTRYLLACDNAGNTYMSNSNTDYGGATIFKINSNGNTVLTIPLAGQIINSLNTDKNNDVLAFSSNHLYKFDPSGNTIWALTNKIEYLLSSAVGQSGNIYLLCWIIGSVNINPGTGNPVVIGQPNQSTVYIEKLDANGNYLGYKILPIYSTLLYADAAENIYINYSDYPTGAFSTSKFDSSLNQLWQTSVTPNGSVYPGNIIADASGNVYISGNISGSITFNSSTTISNTNNTSKFIEKLDSKGNFVWAIQPKLPTLPTGTSAVSVTDSCILTLNTKGIINYSGKVYHRDQSNYATYDLFTISYNPCK